MKMQKGTLKKVVGVGLVIAGWLLIPRLFRHEDEIIGEAKLCKEDEEEDDEPDTDGE